MRVLLAVLFFLPGFLSAQELVEGIVEVVRAQVTDVITEELRLVSGTDLPVTYQTIQARLLEGTETGRIITIENDYLSLTDEEIFYARRYSDESGRTTYTVLEPYRLPQLGALAVLFVSLVALFGGWQGIRGLVSLIASGLFIVYLLLPAIVAGYSPALVSIGSAAVIVIVGSYVTHKVSRMTTAAVLGMVGTIGITGLLAYLSIGWTRMSGLAAEEATYLLLNTRGEIDLAGLYLGGILIGLLGALYDAAIGQAVAVEELRRTDPSAIDSAVFLRALRMGREHIGALVNTLAIAYVGASLPLLLFFYGAPELNMAEALNRELFSSELLRIILSSIGVVLVVPLTTFISVRLIRVAPKRIDSEPRHIGHGH